MEKIGIVVFTSTERKMEILGRIKKVGIAPEKVFFLTELELIKIWVKKYRPKYFLVDAELPEEQIKSVQAEVQNACTHSRIIIEVMICLFDLGEKQIKTTGFHIISEFKQLKLWKELFLFIFSYILNSCPKRTI